MKPQHSRIVRTSVAGLAALSFSLIESASAQAPPGPEREQAQDENLQVVITGSRIARPDSDAPSPVTTLGSDELEKIAATNIGAVVERVARFSGQQQSNDERLRQLQRRRADREPARSRRDTHTHPGGRPALRADDARRLGGPESHPEPADRPHGNGHRRRFCRIRLGCHRGRREYQSQEESHRTSSRRRTTASRTSTTATAITRRFAGGARLLRRTRPHRGRRRVRQAGRHRQLLRARLVPARARSSRTACSTHRPASATACRISFAATTTPASG